MRKWFALVVLASLVVFLILGFGIIENPLAESSFQSPFSYNTSNYHHSVTAGDLPAVLNPENGSQVVAADILVANLFTQRNLSDGEQQSLQSWNQLQQLISQSRGLPHATEAIKEAGAAWESLMVSIEDEKRSASGNTSARQKAKEKQCPYSIRMMNASECKNSSFKLKIPCGLVQGSSVTIIGTPSGLLGNFQIDLTGTTLPGEPDPPIVLHYNVRLHGDKITEDPVIVQNTWTLASDWGPEERCPSPDAHNSKKVDELEQCSAGVGKDDKRTFLSSRHSNASKDSLGAKNGSEHRQYFPFKQGYLAIATLRVGVEGIHMTVDGKHITSFGYRESLEPWLVNEVRIAGDISLISVLASGLPTSEDLEHVIDLEMLKSAPIPMHKAVDLFVGIFSTANNFKRRMAVRRTWMQYESIRTGVVAVRFFVGLHKNEIVNEELWNEARTYGDIQLMPFVDYYGLITWKTIGICIYGINVLSAKYVMKTDDDSFVRIDEVLASLNRVNVTHGLLYGRISSDDRPQRNPDNKWYISPQEFSGEKYPPWAHGPGYVVSRDIAETVYEQYKKGTLKLFKLEDVAMGIWIDEMKKKGLNVRYEKEERVYIDGCEAGYVVAHYQEPREMLCLWQKLQDTHRASCCDL